MLNRRLMSGTGRNSLAAGMPATNRSRPGIRLRTDTGRNHGPATCQITLCKNYEKSFLLLCRRNDVPRVNSPLHTRRLFRTRTEHHPTVRRNAFDEDIRRNDEAVFAVNPFGYRSDGNSRIEVVHFAAGIGSAMNAMPPSVTCTPLAPLYSSNTTVVSVSVL